MKVKQQTLKYFFLMQKKRAKYTKKFVIVL